MKLPGDLRFAVRSLTRSPLFCVVAVLSLALGIGANTAVFTLMDQVLLRQLPVENPGELVLLRSTGAHYGSNTGMNALSYPLYRDIAEQNQVFSGALCRYRLSVSLAYQGHSERVAGELVSGTYFPMLGVRPALGRLFTPEEDRIKAGAPLAVLTYDYWQNRFAGDRSVIGREILVNTHKLTIVGVAQPGFEGVEVLFNTQVFIPVMMAEQITDRQKPLENRRLRWVQVFARLKPGVTRTEAQASLQPLFHRVLEMEVQQPEFAKASPDTRARFLKMSLDVMPGGTGQNVARRFLEAPLWAMTAMVGLVLLIACANVANLMIARATARQKDMAIRLSLGAGRFRIVRQLLVECGLIAMTGGLLGLGIAPFAMRFLIGIFPSMDPPLKLTADPDVRVFCFNLAISLATAFLFGLAPALRAARPDLAPVLKNQAAAVAGGGHTAWRKILVGAQVSLSLLLLIAAILFARTLGNLKDVHPGFDVTNLVFFGVDPSVNGYTTEQSKLFYTQLQEKLAGLPGSRSAALCAVPPLAFARWDSTVTVEGYAARSGEDMNPWVNYVSPGYFSTMKIPLRAGRDFTDLDAAGKARVVIVNEKFARHYFGDRSPLGRHIGEGGDPGTKTDIEIIGVVGDTKYETAREEPPRQVFYAYQQRKTAGAVAAYVRTDRGSAQMFPALREAVRQMDPNLPIFMMKTQEHQRDDSLAVERLSASLSVAFGVLASVLAAVGVYGVMAFLVSRRTREIGIRVALGAVTGNVVWLVMREVLLVAGLGILVALPVAYMVTKLLARQFYGIQPHDPATMIGATLGIAVIAALSGFLPARRATRIDPISALREE